MHYSKILGGGQRLVFKGTYIDSLALKYARSGKILSKAQVRASVHARRVRLEDEIAGYGVSEEWV